MSRLTELVVLAIAAFCLAVLLTQDLGWVIDHVYSPEAIILLVVVFVEYLIIKGGDRSRLYRIELERMHEREQKYVARTRKALDELQQLLDDDAATEWTGPRRADVVESLKRVDQILRPDLEE